MSRAWFTFMVVQAAIGIGLVVTHGHDKIGSLSGLYYPMGLYLVGFAAWELYRYVRPREQA